MALWKIKIGDKFEAGTVFCEVETDKATIAFESQDEGYLAKILADKDVRVGQPLMVVVDDVADVPKFADFVVDASAAPAAAPAAAPKAPAAAPAAPKAAAPAPAAMPVAAAPSSSSSAGGRVVASPYARTLAREKGLSIDQLQGQGTGPNGRIIAADVLSAKPVPVAASAAAVAQAQPQAQVQVVGATAVPSGISINGVYSDFELSSVAMAVAARLTASKQQVPHYYVSVELNLSSLLSMREKFNASLASNAKAGGKAPLELSVLDFIVKAAATAMKQVPDVNGSWMESFVRRYEQVDINVIMGAGAGLSTPVLRNVSAMGLTQIASKVRPRYIFHAVFIYAHRNVDHHHHRTVHHYYHFYYHHVC